jgi:hypothetical protein
VTLKNMIFSLKAHSTTHQKGRLGNWERKIENYLRGRLVFSLGKAATQMRGSKVMLTVRVRLQFNIYTSKIFVTFGFYRSGSVCAGFWFKTETEPVLLKFMVLTIGLIGFSFRFGFFG